MIIPDYWAEARVQRPRKGKDGSVTVRRFGWSVTSQAEAEQMAKERADAALREILAGKKDLPRREPKIPYNGAEGVPIREEILSRHDDVVITRNAYGAQCLNTPDVLFADIDYPDPNRSDEVGCVLLLLVVASIAVSIWQKNALIFFGTLVSALLVGYVWGAVERRTRQHRHSAAVANARKRVADSFAKRPDWHVRLYQTPNGLRLLVLHRTFQPDEPAVKEFFNALGVDPLYAKMCFNQQCFRARVTPKPWRMGMSHIGPRPGVWPVKPEHHDHRKRWIEEYESKAQAFASCQYLESLGPKKVDPKAASVLALHDALSQASSRKPIA